MLSDDRNTMPAADAISCNSLEARSDCSKYVYYSFNTKKWQSPHKVNVIFSMTDKFALLWCKSRINCLFCILIVGGPVIYCQQVDESLGFA